MGSRKTPGRNPMRAPDSGVTIRMYRQGHGDCFLLCFRRSSSDDTPFFLLIDCGMKKGSQVHEGIGTDEVLEDIANATNGVIDLAVVTHEHEDHVSGFPHGDDPTHVLNQRLKVKQLWLAWTEDEEDDFANEIRDTFNDKLLTLAMAGAEMDGMGLDDPGHERVKELLRLETGEDNPALFLLDTARRLGVPDVDLAPQIGMPDHAVAFAAAGRKKKKKPRGFKYKMRLAGLRRHVGEENIEFLDPEAGKVWSLPGVNGVRVYPLGPPRNVKLLRSLDPRKHEEFHMRDFGASEPGFGLFRAFSGRGAGAGAAAPFAARHILPQDPILNGDPVPPDTHDETEHKFLVDIYTGFNEPDPQKLQMIQRKQIGDDWLQDAEALALRVNNEVNNTSLVLLFELPETGKTLLFTGDAQRGNWISWANLSFDGRNAKELLGKCAFYKVGHHGSHNATLAGTAEDDHPNLAWLGRDCAADEFTAMIPTNKDWAWGKSRPWKHPLPAIEDALIKKAQGRVLMTSDKDMVIYDPWNQGSHQAQFEKFEDRTKHRKHYIEHWVPDD